MSEQKTTDNYPLHILTIKLWEWEGVREASLFSIAKHGPEQHTCEALETSGERIIQLKAAIQSLTTQNKEG